MPPRAKAADLLRLCMHIIEAFPEEAAGLRPSTLAAAGWGFHRGSLTARPSKNAIRNWKCHYQLPGSLVNIPNCPMVVDFLKGLTAAERKVLFNTQVAYSSMS